MWFRSVLVNLQVSPAQGLTHTRSSTRQGGRFLLLYSLGLWYFGFILIPAGR